ncbi:MAG: peptidylprolyl isomerase [Paracoccus sp. (in: a-proteobacteria)]|nr:peptidylprolyl isomerase [Paracoccus sp. (in: a-proteobacteria)]
MTSLRTKGKSMIVWILMGLLLLGLGGFGVTSFTGSATDVGAVGETEIDSGSYARALGREISNITRQTGQRLSIDQARQMGLTQAVQAQLFTAAALSEVARKAGISVGDEAVAREITSAAAFQGPGGFDRAAYGEVLRREGMTERDFEAEVREDQARMIIQDAVISGISAPPAQIAQMTGWMLERRDISWVELTPADLGAPVNPADQSTLEAWHQANAARFTAPEIRRITYAWLTPEMLAETVDLDETALREIYDSRAEEFNQPARRMVGRLVFESAEAAQAALDRIAAGQARFEDIAVERGLTLADTDLGEMTEAGLGAAGAQVFAAEDNGVIGPVQTEFGPALIAVNAILDPVDVSFDEALPDLRAEAAADRARRLITDRSPAIEDLLAGGTQLEQLAEETEMELGQIDWTTRAEPVPGEIGGYPAFREHAQRVTDRDYPELFELDDGGIFALRLDETVPPSLIPFDEVREAVAADWAEAEAHRQLVALAGELRLQAVSETMPPVPAANGATPPPVAAPAETEETDGPSAAGLDWNSETGLLRDGYLEHAPPSLVAEAFKLEDGETEILDDGRRVALIRIDRIEDADSAAELFSDVSAGVARRAGMSLQADVFDYFARAIQTSNGVTMNQAAIAAVESRM